MKLKNEVTSLEERLCEQGRYSSKDCIIFENAPFDLNNVRYSICEFLDKCLQIKVKPCDIKVCHPINKGNSLYPPTVVAKFVYSDDKTPYTTAGNFMDVPKT